MRTLSEEPQDDMRVEKLQLIVAAVGLGKLDGTETAKKNVMPSSYAGGLRYMTENFHDANKSICSNGYLHIFMLTLSVLGLNSLFAPSAQRVI